ncbi:MAG: glucosaminidase domain-containing protein [Chitinophagaceae bacterium]
MKKQHLPLLLLFLLVAHAPFAQHSAVIKDYIAQFKEIAMEEMQRTGVPAAIKLAQGIHETAAGQSVLVRKSNNHFGIKCKTGWTGESVSHDDDARGECFRKYDDPTQSYKDHSEFLRTRSHYNFLFTLDPTDYKAWAHGLKKAGYATNPKYPQIIIKLIEDYNLQDYTLIAMGKKEASAMDAWTQNNIKNSDVAAPALTRVTAKSGPSPIEQPARLQAYPSGVFKINETSVVLVPKGTPFLVVAQEHRISLSRLFDFNDLERSEEAAEDILIFLQRKRKTGATEFYTVAEGETLHSIAQAAGIRLESLLEYNMLNKTMQPAVGEKLYLQRKAPVAPRMVNTVAMEKVEPTPAAEAYTLHTVQPKETLYAIAKQYSVSVTDLMQWNGLETTEIKTGQQLRINKNRGYARN